MRVIRGGARVVRWVERSDLPLRQDQPPFADAQKKRLRKEHPSPPQALAQEKPQQKQQQQ